MNNVVDSFSLRLRQRRLGKSDINFEHSQTPLKPYKQGYANFVIKPLSCLHAVAVLLVELVTGLSKLFGDHIAEVHQVIEALFQGFQGSRRI